MLEKHPTMIPKNISLEIINKLLEDNNYKGTLINKNSITIREIWEQSRVFPSSCPLISGYNLYISTNLTELFFKMLKVITNQLRANFMLQYKKEKKDA